MEKQSLSETNRLALVNKKYAPMKVIFWEHTTKKTGTNIVTIEHNCFGIVPWEPWLLVLCPRAGTKKFEGICKS